MSLLSPSSRRERAERHPGTTADRRRAVEAVPPETASIELAGVTRWFAGTVAPAVAAVSLAVQRGEILALLGASGCGKTTTLRLIAGFERADGGRIRIDGTIVADEGGHMPPERRKVGMVFQDYALFPHMTVAENVAFGLTSGSRGERRARVAEVLTMVGLAGMERRYPHQLSGGQQQRVALARALAPQPRVVLLDEPFSNLDSELRARVRGEVREILRGAGATAVLVTHDREEAFAVADRVALMDRGRLVQIGTPADLYHAPVTAAAASFLGMADFLPAVVAGGSAVSEIGRFPVSEETPPGEAQLLVRPEDVLFGEDGTPATVLTREFRGADSLYVLMLPSGRRLRAVCPAGASAREGETVLVQRRAGAATVLPIDPSLLPTIGE